MLLLNFLLMACTPSETETREPIDSGLSFEVEDLDDDGAINCDTYPGGENEALQAGEICDCNDGDATIHPGAEEVCGDTIDYNCDGEQPIGSLWYYDYDSDGYGDENDFIESCDQPENYVDQAGDCDDNDPLSYPGAEEICDERDNDCDGSVDQGVTQTYYQDSDNDGFGNTSSFVEACEVPDGYSEDSSDCDDGDENINPDAQEVCDDIDNDCDDFIDDADRHVSGQTRWYEDGDGDGFGTSDVSRLSCDQPVNYTDNDDDCDDDNAAINPGASEECDGIDNNCDGVSDDISLDDGTTIYDPAVCADVLIEGDSGDEIGTAISLGDLDGDSYDDVLIGAPYFDDSGSNDGAVYLVFGPLSSNIDLATDADELFTGDEPGAHSGFSVAFVGDMNGDGVPEFIVGAPDYDSNGAVFLLNGTSSSGNLFDQALDLSLASSTYDELGYSVASAGDVNGDGLADLLYGNIGYSTSSSSSSSISLGRITLVYGANPISDINLDGDYFVRGLSRSDQVGMSLSSGGTGDIDGDGCSDIFFGVPQDDENSNNQSGSVYLFYGSTTLRTGTYTLNSADEHWDGKNSSDYLGLSVTNNGDFNGDGYDDLVACAPYNDDAGTNVGKCYVITDRAPSSGRMYLSSNVSLVDYYGTGSRVAFMEDHDGDGDDELMISNSVAEDQEGSICILNGRSYDGSFTSCQRYLESSESDARLGTAMVSEGGITLISAPGVDEVYLFNSERL